MGYCSDIKLIITTNDKKFTAEKILSLLNKGAYEDLKKLCDTNFKIVNEDGTQKIYFQADYVKWYENFKEVLAFNKWINKISEIINNDKYENIGYHYVRIGDDISDIDEIIEGSPAEYLHVYRGVDFE